MESRYARDPFPSQIFIPAAERGREEVEPDMNQRSSVRTARRNTRFVVRRGRIGVPVGDVRENFKGAGAKREIVPVPVLFDCFVSYVLFWEIRYIYIMKEASYRSGRCSPVSRISRIKSRY